MEEENKDEPSTSGYPLPFIGPPPTPSPLPQSQDEGRALSSSSLVGEYLLSATPEPSSSDDNDDDNNNNNAPSVPVKPEPTSQVEIVPSIPRSGNKPPRAATKPSHNAQQKSIGDYSFLSALTEVSDVDTEIPPPPLKKLLPRPRAVSNRSVSFDQNVDAAFLGINGTAQPQQPLSTMRQISTASTNRWEKLSLSDIVSPMESEAETAIFRAVEAHRRQQSTTTDIILPIIPNDTVHSFEQETTPTWGLEASESYDDEKKDQFSVPSSLLGSVSIATPPKQQNNVGYSAAPPSPARSKQSTSSHARIGPAKNTTAANDSTLEGTLFGLSAAMRDIHSTSNEASALADSMESRRRRLASSDVGRPGNTGWEVEAHTRDQDAFVHNASLLFRRHVNAPDDEPLLHPAQQITTPDGGGSEHNKSSWNCCGRNRGQANPKKTDIFQEGHELDIEEGASTSSTNVASGKAVPPKTFGNKIATTWNKSKQFVEGTHDIAMHTPGIIKRATFNFKEDLEVFKSFLKPRQDSMKAYIRTFLLYVLLPTLGISTLLFYAFGNPTVSFGCISNSNIPGAKPDCPSMSWFLNFLIIRQAITFSLAKATGIFLIDFLALKTRVVLRLLGPIPTLMFVQSKGWPFQIAVWAIYSIILNSGNNQFAENWLFYQKGIGMFNAANPSGDIPNGDWNRTLLWNAIFVGFAVALKRFFVGLYLGQRTYAIYGNQLAKVIHQMIVIGQVSLLGRDLEMRSTDPVVADSRSLRHKKSGTHFDWSWKGFDGTGLGDDDDNSEGGQGNHISPHIETEGVRSPVSETEDTIYIERQDPFADSSGRVKMLELLEAWEEPESDPGKPQNISISAILQFRQSLAFMDLSYPFSISFGLADTRAHCVESSQGVYRRLMHYNPKNTSGILEFDALASLAKLGDDPTAVVIDSDKMKDLIRLFRPDRQGNLTMLDFVKSVDAVYKKLRLLRASINGSSQIDRATEFMINCLFYFTLFCIILARLKIDPLKFFLSMSSVILAFAFMIGSASAKYFEGILFILVRQPYDIGDRIAISDPTKDTNVDGSSCWYVESVDLYTTTVRSGATNEVATLTNGALASARVINAARSPRALVYLHLKFGVDVPYAKVQLFRKTVEEFVKARPREWLSLSGFRACKVETDLGYIAYVISCQHREAWQNLVPILQSKADLFSYCLEVQKQLDMRYSAPSLPVDLQIKGQNPANSLHNVPVEVPGRSRSNTGTALEGIEALANLFTIRSAT